MEIEFRIVERKREDGTIIFLPEREIEADMHYEWININTPDYTYHTTYEDALMEIKKFINEHEEPNADKIHELPKLTLRYDINEKSLKAEAYRRGFVKGTVFIPCEDNSIRDRFPITIGNPDKITYKALYGALYYNEKYAIYIYGRWAEIISKKTK